MAEKKVKKEKENYLENNEFILKVKEKEEIKELTLRPYSFSIQIKLLKSGMLNRLTEIQQIMPAGADISGLDYIKLGELLELSVDIIYEMLPKEIQISKDKDQLMDSMVDGEPIRFINWIISQFGKNNSFLAPENPAKEVTNPPK